MKTILWKRSIGVRCFRVPLAGCIAVLFLTVPRPFAAANLIFFDAFSYPTGYLNGKGPPPNSPPGQTAWITSTGKPKVTPPDLLFPGVFSAGKTANVLSPNYFHNGDKVVAFHNPVTAADGIVWVGFLVRMAVGDPVPSGYAVVSLGSDLDGPSPGIGLMFQLGVYGIDNDTGVSRGLTSIVPSSETVWLVAKLNFLEQEEYLWANPSPDTEPSEDTANAHLPMTDYFYANGFAQIQLKIGYAHALFQFDELRVATTFEEIVNPFVGK